MLPLLSKERIVAQPGFNRWLVPPASIAIHLCIGSVYAWSLFNPPLVKLLGVAASAADDWTLAEVTRVFTIAIVCLGLSAAVGGKWLEKAGPRMVGTVAAFCWGGGFLLGGLGIVLHQLWLLYLGYGVIGGCGLGLGYVSPVSTLLKWFPDRRGMAAGMAIMGFGGGAIIAAPLNEALIRTFYEAPEFLGTEETVPLETREGRRFAETSNGWKEVVAVSPQEAANMIVPGAPGVYVVGTGRTGVAETFFVLGVSYFVIMILAAFSYRIPPDGWAPPGWAPPSASATPLKMISTRQVGVDQALRTPQFYLLWIVLCLNVTAGIGVLGVAKTMITEIFGSALPQIVTARFAAFYVLMISVANMLGRFFWASASDWLGRKTTYTLFFVLGIALYLGIPVIANQVSRQPSVIWLAAFCVSTLAIFTMYGGGFSTIPAYLADLFGTKNVGAIHGRLLTAWSVAGALGPWAITWFREASTQSAMRQLAETADPARFQQAFGAGTDQLDALIASKTVTISRLMEIVPAGTPDPSSQLYNSTMFVMAGLLGVALVGNLLVSPVDPRHDLENGSAA